MLRRSSPFFHSVCPNNIVGGEMSCSYRSCPHLVQITVPCLIPLVMPSFRTLLLSMRRLVPMHVICMFVYALTNTYMKSLDSTIVILSQVTLIGLLSTGFYSETVVLFRALYLEQEIWELKNTSAGTKYCSNFSASRSRNFCQKSLLTVNPLRYGAMLQFSNELHTASLCYKINISHGMYFLSNNYLSDMHYPE